MDNKRGKGISTIQFAELSKYRGELMGLAMIFVVLFHVGMPQSNFFYPLRRLGNVGVDMFLFVSGIGLWFSWTHSRLGKKLDGIGAMDIKSAVIRFFKNRYRRIYPVWLIVAAIFYICRYIEGKGGAATPDVPNLIANILFNWSFWRVDDLTFWYVPATMMLYIFAPWYMELIRKSPTFRWLPIAFILLAAMVQYVPLLHDNVGHLEIFFSRIPIFFIGINAGKWVMEKRELERGSIWMAIIVFIMSMWLCLRLEFIGHRAFPLFMERIAYIPLTISALILECKLADILPKGANSFLTLIGGISLEIYLIHIEFVMRPLQEYQLGYCLTALLVLSISIPAAWLIHWAIGKGVSTAFDRKNVA